MSAWKNSRQRAFTLIELLTVIAIIGILSAIIIPTTGAVRKAAKKTQTKTLFGQWIQAATLFKTEYGYYPNLGTDGTANLISTTDDTLEFVRTFTGKNLDGTALGTTASDIAKLNGNKKRQTFLNLGVDDIQNSLLVDAFGNTEFGIIMDRNGDGVIKDDENGASTVVTVKANATGADFTPTTGTAATADIPANGVRAGVIIYSAGSEGGASSGVMSWK